MLKTILKVLGLLFIIGIGLTVYHTAFASKTAYIEIDKVFNGFDMKKELQQKFEKTHATRKKIIDSLSFDLQLLSQKLKEKQDDKELMHRFDLLKQDFYKKKKEFDEDNANLSSQYDKQILEQMTQYVMDYGKENSYDLIYGADGSGMLMYANENQNISEDVLSYINNKYKGVE